MNKILQGHDRTGKARTGKAMTGQDRTGHEKFKCQKKFLNFQKIQKNWEKFDKNTK